MPNCIVYQFLSNASSLEPCLARPLVITELFNSVSPSLIFGSELFDLQGIYRVNGAKSRVEKLCQAFENGKDLVELSDLYPHDISNVLKLYLRQVTFVLRTHTHTLALRCVGGNQ